MPAPIRIAIVEDIVDVADVLREAINDEDDMECTQYYSNAEDALIFLPKNPPDVVVMDIGLPRKSGIEAVNQLSGQLNDTQFCMYTIYEDDDKVFQALQAGATGYVLKGEDPDTVISALRELHAGGSPMSPSIARQVIEAFRKMPVKKEPEALPLTSRETELLNYLADGLLYKEIASYMSITTGTVKQHIHKIYGKLQVSNRTEAINRFRGFA